MADGTHPVELRYTGVTMPKGTVFHWKRFSPTWAPPTADYTLCGKYGSLDHAEGHMPECQECARRVALANAKMRELNRDV